MNYSWILIVAAVLEMTDADAAVFEKIDELLPNKLDSSTNDVNYHGWIFVVNLNYLMIY